MRSPYDIQCPECLKEGVNSQIQDPGFHEVTCVYYAQFTDDLGYIHHHDSNERSYGNWCTAQKHFMTVYVPHKCPSPHCDWVQTLKKEPKLLGERVSDCAIRMKCERIEK